MTDKTNPYGSAPASGGPSRRVILKGAAWTIPAVAVAVAAPLASASGAVNYAIESNFGVGWYPTTANQTDSGALQYDAGADDKYLRITGTSAGDVITGVYFEVLFSGGWPAPSFTPLPGSNTSWSTLAQTGTTVVGGTTYNVYRSSYSGTVVATGSTTTIPIDFFFRSASAYFPNNTAQTRRFATVNSTVVTLLRNPAQIVNTNVPLSQAPTP